MVTKKFSAETTDYLPRRITMEALGWVLVFVAVGAGVYFMMKKNKEKDNPDA